LPGRCFLVATVLAASLTILLQAWTGPDSYLLRLGIAFQPHVASGLQASSTSGAALESNATPWSDLSADGGALLNVHTTLSPSSGSGFKRSSSIDGTGKASSKKSHGCLPVVDTYVINLDSRPELYMSFLDHFQSLCGSKVGDLQRHPGVVVSANMHRVPWVQDLIPGILENCTLRPGNLGLALAHLTLWAKIAQSPGCTEPDSEGDYVLVFEDDERPNQGFVAAVAQIVKLVQSMPADDRPDFILLNALRPHGKFVKHVHGTPLSLQLWRVEKMQRSSSEGPLHPKFHMRYNIWMSVYLVRCGGARALAHHSGRYPAGKPGHSAYDGVRPVFDRHFSDMISDADVPIQTFVMYPTNMLSKHVEDSSSARAAFNSAGHQGVSTGGLGQNSR